MRDLLVFHVKVFLEFLIVDQRMVARREGIDYRLFCAARGEREMGEKGEKGIGKKAVKRESRDGVLKGMPEGGKAKR